MQIKSVYSLAACSHYVFTAFPFENLGERGFELDQSLNRELQGVMVQTLPMKSPTGSLVHLEFREILDEEEFVESERRHSVVGRGRDLLRPSLRFFGPKTEEKVVGSLPVKVFPPSDSHHHMGVHTNTVQNIWGIYLGLTAADQEAWTNFLGVEPVHGEWILADGVRLIVARPGDGLYEYMELRKDFPLWAVILQCGSFSEFEKKAEPERVLKWRGHQTALIKEHLTDWDLLIIEESPERASP